MWPHSQISSQWNLYISSPQAVEWHFWPPLYPGRGPPSLLTRPADHLPTLSAFSATRLVQISASGSAQDKVHDNPVQKTWWLASLSAQSLARTLSCAVAPSVKRDCKCTDRRCVQGSNVPGWVRTFLFQTDSGNDVYLLLQSKAFQEVGCDLRQVDWWQSKVHGAVGWHSATPAPISGFCCRVQCSPQSAPADVSDRVRDVS